MSEVLIVGRLLVSLKKLVVGEIWPTMYEVHRLYKKKLVIENVMFDCMCYKFILKCSKIREALHTHIPYHKNTYIYIHTLNEN